MIVLTNCIYIQLQIDIVFSFDLIIFTECQPGYFGQNCQSQCHCNVDGCATITGECNNQTAGCKIPWTERNCATRKD